MILKSYILVLIRPLSSNSRYKSKNDADEAVSVVSLTSSSGGYINGRNSANLELFIDKTSSIYLYIILPEHLNFHYFSLFMAKIHTTVIHYIIIILDSCNLIRQAFIVKLVHCLSFITPMHSLALFSINMKHMGRSSTIASTSPLQMNFVVVA